MPLLHQRFNFGLQLLLHGFIFPQHTGPNHGNIFLSDSLVQFLQQRYLPVNACNPLFTLLLLLQTQLIPIFQIFTRFSHTIYSLVFAVFMAVGSLHRFFF